MDQTLQQLANELGLSVMSISRALQGRGGVSEGTRQRVQAAADAAGYRPNLVARALLTGRTDNVGIIARDFSATSNAMLFSALESHLRRAGLQALPAAHANDPRDEEIAVSRLLDQRVDGLVIIQNDRTMSEGFRQALVRVPAPTIVLSLNGSRSTESPDVICDLVAYDEVATLRAAALYLLEGGRTRLLLLGSSDKYTQAHATDEWRRAHHEFGATPDTRLMHFTDEKVNAADAIVSILLQRGTRPFDAIVAATDLLAAGAIRACHRARLALGRRHQDEVSVVCASNSPACTLLDPSLTCFSPPFDEMAAQCTRRLQDQLRHPANWRAQEFEFPPILVERHIA